MTSYNYMGPMKGPHCSKIVATGARCPNSVTYTYFLYKGIRAKKKNRTLHLRWKYEDENQGLGKRLWGKMREGVAEGDGEREEGKGKGKGVGRYFKEHGNKTVGLCRRV